MAPKKKTNKKADDWESELGESAEPVADATPAAQEEAEEDEYTGGGLMAAMKKKAKNKKGKGKPVEDFVEGEDPPAAAEPDLATKAPEEATMEEEFALPEKKGKGKAAAPAKVVKDEDEDEERGTDGKILTKKEKEKLKKEREKQRKKEQVRQLLQPICHFNQSTNTLNSLQQRRRLPHPLPKPQRLPKIPPHLKPKLKPHKPQSLQLVAKPRNFLHISKRFESSRKN